MRKSERRAPKRFVKTPGGRSKVQIRKVAAKPARCGMCGAILAGVPRARPPELSKIPRSSRRPNRPYGGNLCPSCSRRVIKELARA